MDPRPHVRTVGEEPLLVFREGSSDDWYGPGRQGPVDISEDAIVHNFAGWVSQEQATPLLAVAGLAHLEGAIAQAEDELREIWATWDDEDAGDATPPPLSGRLEFNERVRPPALPNQPRQPGDVRTNNRVRRLSSAVPRSWQLGHRNSIVTRAVYVHEIKTSERTARRRQRIEAASAGFLSAQRE